jgi:uncharacterized protein (TIGR03083 family)
LPVHQPTHGRGGRLGPTGGRLAALPLGNARAHLQAERRALLRLCRQLSPAEWEAPSLCAGWRVRDVVAHVLGGAHDAADLRPAGGLDAWTARSVAKRHDWPTAALLRELETIVHPRGIERLFVAVLLLDNWTHQEDIRRPLGRPRLQDPARLRWLLRFGRLAPLWNARGLRLVATDLDVAVGRGPEARGPAADLILAVLGRRSAAAHLSGPGAARLHA